MNPIDHRDVNITRHRLESYRLLSGIFLTLPDEALVTNLLHVHMQESLQSPGMQQIADYIKRGQSSTVQSVLQELASDRTRLFRGISEDGPLPPYESSYLNQPPQDIIGGLNRFYARINYGVSNDLKESPEQIGVEFSYMQVLCEKELKALEKDLLDEADEYRRLQESFLKQHLGRWAGLFAQEMERHAQTDFYRGIALLIQELIREELATRVYSYPGE
jgi:TorA maturation chaperone TorD